jgi:hypothetical protein
MPHTNEQIPISEAAVAQRVQGIRRAVKRARSRIRRVLVLRPTAWVVTGTLAGLVLIGGLDALMRLSIGMRVLLLVALIGGVGYVLARIVRRALTTRIARTDLASHLERAIAQRGQKVVPGLLAVGLQFAKANHHAHRQSAPATAATDPVTESFRRNSLRTLAQTYTPEIIRGAVDPYPTRRALGVAVMALVAVGMLAALAPDTTSLAARRIFTPWSDAAWPLRFPVDDRTAVRVHPADTALLLRAETVERARGVRLQYRVLTPTDTRTDTPTDTSTDFDAPKADTKLAEIGETITERMLIQDARNGTASYETLLDPSKWIERQRRDLGQRVGSGVHADRPILLEYWFITADAQTAPSRILVTPPPRVESANLTLRLPEYARGTAAAFARDGVIKSRPLGEIEVVEPVLAGTEVALTLTYSKPITGWERWEASLLPKRGIATEPAPIDQAEAAPRLRDRIEITGVIDRTGEIKLDATDRYGIPDRRPTSLRLAVQPDRASEPAIINPARDEAVLATATVEVLGEARDDVGLHSLTITAQRLVPRADSPGAIPEPFGDELELARSTIDAAPAQPPLTARVSNALRPSEFGAQAGDTILVHAVSTDRRPGRADAARSVPRRLLIISEQTFVDQIRRELGGVRNAARTLDEEQARVRSRTTEAAREAANAQATSDATDQKQQERMQSAADAAEDLLRASANQDALTQRLTGQRRRLEQLEQRVATNGLEDESLSGLLEQARALVERAEDASQRAAEQTQRAAESTSAAAGSSTPGSRDPSGESNPGENNPGENRTTQAGEDALEAAQAAERASREADDQQRSVRDELGQLMERLDLGEDAWLARRSIERLLDEQRAITEQTQQVSEQTLGRDTAELTDEERGELERIAERQREIAQEAQAALDNLDDRARDLAESDSAQSEALATAARRARQEALSEQLEQAAEQVGQNQTGQAAQNQAQAMETLEDVLDELDSVDARRAEELKRQLADLAAMIETLIRTQSREIAQLDANLDAARAAADAPSPQAMDDRATGMIMLNRNTVAAVDQAIAEIEMQASVVAEPLERAGDAQVSAIMNLRLVPVPDAARAREFAGVSLRALEEALAAAEGLLEQAEEDEQRRALEELLAQYRSASESQRALREDTSGYAQQALTRRQRAEVRSLSVVQRELGESIADLGERVGEFSRLGMLEFTHGLLDESVGRAVDTLAGGRADQSVLREQLQVNELLDSIVAALDPSDDGESPFNQPGQQGEGGGQGSGQEPPPTLDLAELMLLRSVQERIARLTREADETGIEAPTTLQRQLADLIVEMLERLEEEQAPPPADPAAELPAELPTGPQEGAGQ